MRVTAWTNEEYARKHYIDPSDERLNLMNPNKKMITPNELKELAETDGISVEEYEKWNQEFEKILTFTDEKKAKELMQIYKEIEQTVIEHCKEKGIRFSADYHQYGKYGVPIIDNKYMYYTFARTWGWIMAQADCDDSDMGYLKYYLHGNEHAIKYPNKVEESLFMSDFYIFLEEDEGLTSEQIDKLDENELNKFFKKYIKLYKVELHKSDT